MRKVSQETAEQVLHQLGQDQLFIALLAENAKAWSLPDLGTGILQLLADRFVLRVHVCPRSGESRSSRILRKFRILNHL